MKHQFSRRLGHHIGWFYDETWRANIDLIWPVTPKQVRDFMWCRHHIRIDLPGPFNAKCLEVVDEKCTAKQGNIVICLRQWKGTVENWASLAHEALHAAHWILSARGLKLSDQSDEAYCYTMDSIIRRCGLLLHKKK